jgi:hypothetical protein
VTCEFRLFLILEKCIMKYLIVDVDLAHLWLHPLTHLLLQCLILVISLFSNLHDTRLFNEIRELKWSLVHASLVLKVPSLLAPVSGDWH